MLVEKHASCRATPKLADSSLNSVKKSTCNPRFADPLKDGHTYEIISALSGGGRLPYGNGFIESSIAITPTLARRLSTKGARGTPDTASFRPPKRARTGRRFSESACQAEVFALYGRSDQERNGSDSTADVGVPISPDSKTRFPPESAPAPRTSPW